VVRRELGDTSEGVSYREFGELLLDKPISTLFRQNQTEMRHPSAVVLGTTLLLNFNPQNSL
jgi:hypothetical protein